jgi:hypothetical protein
MTSGMNAAPRNECLIYDGAPSRHLPSLAAAAKTRLEQGYRCLYLNSPVMVAGMRSISRLADWTSRTKSPGRASSSHPTRVI